MRFLSTINQFITKNQIKMKRVFYFLAFILTIPVLTSCDFYCTWAVVDGVRDAFSGKGWGEPPLIDTYLDFDADGGERTAEFKSDYNFYMVMVESDTIYRTLNKTFQEKSMQNGYTFEMNNRYISGHGLTLDGTYTTKLKVKLDPNTSDKPRYMEVCTGHAFDEERGVWGPRSVIAIRQKAKVEK